MKRSPWTCNDEFLKFCGGNKPSNENVSFEKLICINWNAYNYVYFST